MSFSPSFLRPALLGLAAAAGFLPAARAADPMRVVFQNGRSVLLSSLAMQGNNLVTTTAGDGFTQGQTISMESIDHVYGEKPATLNAAIALLLSGKPADAEKLLEPISASLRLTAKIPGNFWIETAHALLVAYAVQGNSAKVTDIGKEISDATPEQGIDPFVTLGKALQMPVSTKIEDRALALKDLATDDSPADLGAYATFYRASLLDGAKRSGDTAEAMQQTRDILETYLAVPCLYPTGGMILNGAAELKAAEILAGMDRREEAVALLNSATRHTNGTSIVVEANKRLESLK